LFISSIIYPRYLRTHFANEDRHHTKHPYRTYRNASRSTGRDILRRTPNCMRNGCSRHPVVPSDHMRGKAVLRPCNAIMGPPFAPALELFQDVVRNVSLSAAAAEDAPARKRAREGQARGPTMEMNQSKAGCGQGSRLAPHRRSAERFRWRII
jgi:hypothetical protein